MLQRQVAELQGKISRLHVEIVEIDRHRAEEGRWTQEKADLFSHIRQLEKQVRVNEEEIRELKGKIVRREAECASGSKSMKNDIANSYVVGFEAALEQAYIVHPGWISLRSTRVMRWLMES